MTASTGSSPSATETGLVEEAAGELLQPPAIARIMPALSNAAHNFFSIREPPFYFAKIYTVFPVYKI